MSWTFFTDRDLGEQFPALLKEAGFSIERHADHFKHNEKDEVWLRVIAKRGWVILTHDQRIRYKVNEKEAVLLSRARMLVVIAKLPYPDLARGVVNTHRRILAFLDRTPAPFIAKIYQPASVVLLRNPQASGRLELRLP